MSWFKNHKDMVYIIGSVAMAAVWMTTSVHNVEKRTDKKIEALSKNIDDRFVVLERDVADLSKNVSVIKAVLIMKGNMPKELAMNMEKRE